MMFCLGIDPGKKGAVAVVDSGLHGARVWGWPGDAAAAADLARGIVAEYCPRLAAVEKVGAMPKQGVRSMFTFGENYGCWQGILAALSVPYVLVVPRKWRASVFDSASRASSPKQASLALARRLFPDVDLTRKGDDGKAEALLLALYATRLLTGERGIVRP